MFVVSVKTDCKEDGMVQEGGFILNVKTNIKFCI